MNSESKLSSRASLSIFLIALAVRAVYVLAQHQFSFLGGAFVSGDSPFYLEIARNILSGNGIAYSNAPTAYVSPGFPVFLAGCLGVFGENLLWTSLFQCLLSATACVFIALTASAMFGNRAGIFAGLIAAFYYELVLWTSGQILTEPLYTFLLAAAIYFLISASATEPTAKFEILRFAVAGLLFGLAALTRPLALPVALILGFLMISAGVRRERGKLKAGLIFTAACLLTMQSWAIRNYLVFDQYLLTSNESGHVFWLGNNPEYDLYEHPDFKRFGGYTVMFQPPPSLAGQLQGKTQPEKNRIYFAEARRHIFEHPAAFFARAAHKTWNMWRPGFSGSSLPNKLISHTLYPLVLGFSLTGVYLAVRRLKSETFSAGNLLLKLTEPAGLLSVLLLAHLFIHAVVNAEIRFRVPLWTALIPFASLTAAKIYDYLKSPAKRKT